MRPEIEARHTTMTFGPVVVHFFVYNSLADNETRIEEMKRFFERMPPQHLPAIYPILLIENHPTREVGEGGGGTPTSGTGDLTPFYRHGDRTTVPREDAEEIVREVGGGHRLQGLHYIPVNRWRRDDRDRRALTLFHEIGHGVDYEMRLTSATGGVSLTEADFPGPLNARECGGLYPEKKRAAIYYSHLIVSGRPFPGHGANARATLATFRRTLAFREVPASWFENNVDRLLLRD